MEWSESFKKNIEITVKKINTLFTKKSIDNSIITLDFTFFVPEQTDNNKWKVLIYQYAPEEYVNLLNELYAENDDKFAKFDNKTKVVRDLSNSTTLIGDIKPQNPQEYKNQTLNNENFTPKKWHNDLMNKNFGGASIVVSKEYDKDSYHIQAGVYLVLEKKFGYFPSDTFETGANPIENINNDTSKSVVKEIWAILENLLFDEMFEIVVGEYQKVVSGIERLRNVSASAHVIKTTINGLFAPSLNSLLLEDNVDDRIKELQTAKNKLLSYAELINLMSKLSSPYKNDSEITESLIKSELFSTDKNKLGNIKSVLEEVTVLRERDSKLAKLVFTFNSCDNISENAFVYANKYYPAKPFYELLLLTIIENVVEHGAQDDGKLSVSINLYEKEITFINKPKPNSKKSIDIEDMTGNFRVFHTILNRLELGVFDVSNNTDEFKVTLKIR